MSNFIDFKENNYIERSASFNAYCEEVRKYQPLTDEEVDSLITRMRSTDNIKEQQELRDKIIMPNQRLLISTAKHYNTNDLLDIMDLISEGYFGLCDAVRTYQPGRGSRFASYAVMWIRDYMAKLIYAANIVNRPNDKKTASIYNKCYERLYIQNEGIVSDEELLREVNKLLNVHNQVSDIRDIQPISFASYSDPSDSFEEESRQSITMNNEYNPGYNLDEEYLATDGEDKKSDAKRLIKMALEQIKKPSDRELICDLYGIDREPLGYTMMSMKYGATEATIHKREERILKEMKGAIPNSELND